MFCQALGAAYPEAIKLRLVQDNLNTHTISAFYENLPADEAFALAQRFEFYFTPKSASWLNMIELEFLALSRLCLDCRIPTFDCLEAEILNSILIIQPSILPILNSSFLNLQCIYLRFFGSGTKVSDE